MNGDIMSKESDKPGQSFIYPPLEHRSSAVGIEYTVLEELKEWAMEVGISATRIATKYIREGVERDRKLYTEEVKKRAKLREEIAERERIIKGHQEEIENLRTQLEQMC